LSEQSKDEEEGALKHPTTGIVIYPLKSVVGYVYGLKGFVPHEDLLTEFARRKALVDANKEKQE